MNLNYKTNKKKKKKKIFFRKKICNEPKKKKKYLQLLWLRRRAWTPNSSQTIIISITYFLPGKATLIYSLANLYFTTTINSSARTLNHSIAYLLITINNSIAISLTSLILTLNDNLIRTGKNFFHSSSNSNINLTNNNIFYIICPIVANHRTLKIHLLTSIIISYSICITAISFIYYIYLTNWNTAYWSKANWNNSDWIYLLIIITFDLISITITNYSFLTYYLLNSSVNGIIVLVLNNTALINKYYLISSLNLIHWINSTVIVVDLLPSLRIVDLYNLIRIGKQHRAKYFASSILVRKFIKKKKNKNN